MEVKELAMAIYSEVSQKVMVNNFAGARRAIRKSKSDVRGLWRTLLDLAVKNQNGAVLVLLVDELEKITEQSVVIDFLLAIDQKITSSFLKELQSLGVNHEELHQAIDKYHALRALVHKVVQRKRKNGSAFGHTG